MPKISFLNYNSFQKSQGHNDVPNEYKTERNTLFAEHEIKRFDIISLQEQFTFINPRPVRLLEKALENGFKYAYKYQEPDYMSNMIINGGLLILSRYPVVEADGRVFDPSIARDRIMAKGVIWAKIELPNKSHVHVFNTHLLATFNDVPENVYIMCKLRAIDQIRQLRIFIQDKLNKHYDKGDLAILCGDFNVDSLNDKFSCGTLFNYVELDKKLESLLMAERNELKFYEHILTYNNNLFKLSHIYYRDHQYFPITIGKYTVDDNGNKIPMEDVITAENERLDPLNLDHMYELIVNNREDNSKVWVRPKSSKVEEFFVKNQVFMQLSDHYGLSLEIEYIN